MIGQKKRTFKTHLDVSLETLVPAKHFYRELESKLDLSFVGDLVADKYCWWNGRPSLDPIVFFKLQLIMFFEDIRSERLLLEQVAMNLAHRWYIGYDLDEAVPDHSTLSRTRDRYGLVVFQRFFEMIVEQCIAAGLVWGQELYFDGSLVEANADFDQQVPRFYHAVQNHLQARFEVQADTDKSVDRHFVHKYDGQERAVRDSSYQRQVDYWLNPCDADASPMGKFKLGYRTHYVIDGGKARIILACLVTPTTIQDNTPMIDLAWWARFRWQLPLQVAVGDTKYGTADNIAALEMGGIQAFTSLIVAGNRSHPGMFPNSRFHYDAERDCYICPHGAVLHYLRTYQNQHLYRTKDNVCKHCPLRAQCTTSKRGRSVTHSIYKPFLDRVAAYQQTEPFKKAMRKRQVWVEPKFAESKLWHHGRRFRLRRIHRVNIEALLRATVQNIKQLLKAKPHKPFNPQPTIPRVVVAFCSY